MKGLAAFWCQNRFAPCLLFPMQYLFKLIGKATTQHWMESIGRGQRKRLEKTKGTRKQQIQQQQ